MRSRHHVLAIDQGTTGTHVCIVDQRLSVVGRAYRELSQHFPKPGWVEHDLSEMWQSTEACIARALRDAQIKPSAISAIGLTNQRETAGAWMREGGQPLHRAIVWQDRRTSARCAELKAQRREPLFRRRTGLVLDPYFSATKLEWLLAHVKGLRNRAERGEACLGTVDAWLVYKLTGGRAHLTEASNASRTLLMNLDTLEWDPLLCQIFGIPLQALPEIRGSAEVYGTTFGLRALPDGIPVAGMAGDQQAALFGQACFRPGDAKCTYGTGAFLLMNTGRKKVFSTAGLLTTVAWKLGGETHYALEGSAFVAGAAVQWLRDGLGIIKRASDLETLAEKATDAGELVFVPALAGLGAPHWRPNARGLFCGIDRSTSRAELARAVLRGLALQIQDLAEAMREDTRRPIASFKVDGGAAANNLLMQLQADILGVPVIRPKDLETTSFGAAFLGGLGAGVWKSPDEIKRVWKADRTFVPQMRPSERKRQLALWHRALSKA